MAGYGPLPPVPGVIKIVIENQGNDGRLAENVFHYSYTGAPPSGADCVAIATEIWNEWVGFYTPTQPAQVSLTKITVTDLSSDTGASGEYTNGNTPVPGTSAHGMLPYHTAFVISKLVNRRYRGGHPRSYLPIGTTNDLNDDGDWKSTSYLPWVTTWQFQIILPLSGVLYGATTLIQEVAVSYVSKHVNPVYPYRRAIPLVLTIPLDGYSGLARLGTQRRRVR